MTSRKACSTNQNDTSGYQNKNKEKSHKPAKACNNHQRGGHTNKRKKRPNNSLKNTHGPGEEYKL
jgi:hypothetical protein